MRYARFVALTVGGLVFSGLGPLETSGLAATHADFHCMQAPVTGGAYKMAVKGTACAGGAAQKARPICFENVLCGYITDGLKAAARKKTGKRFESLTLKQKGDFLAKRTDFKAWPSLLTCAGEEGAPGEVPRCPIPEQCKGDLYYEYIQGADMDMVELKEAAAERPIFEAAPPPTAREGR